MSYSHLRCMRYVTLKGTLIVPCSRYIQDILTSLNMDNCNLAPTPITSVRKPEGGDGEILGPTEGKTYRRVVGIARYLRLLRPDLGFVVKEVSHRLQQPQDDDLKRLKRMARYCSGTTDLGVFMPTLRGEAAESLKLIGYSDSDWAGDKVSRKSTSSGAVYLGPIPPDRHSKVAGRDRDK